MKKPEVRYHPKSVTMKLRLLIFMIRSFEKIIPKITEDKPVFDNHLYPWIKTLELHTDEILQEALQLSGKIPYMDIISNQQKKIVEPEKWKVFILKIYGRFIDKNCLMAPLTFQLTKEIEGIYTVLFSVLTPGTHLKAHRGPFKGVLRYHLALKVPVDYMGCGIKIDTETYHWKKGESLVFDDSFIHEAWNNSTEERIVLFIDVERKLPFLFAIINRFIIGLMGRSPMITEMLEKG